MRSRGSVPIAEYWQGQEGLLALNLFGRVRPITFGSDYAIVQARSDSVTTIHAECRDKLAIASPTATSGT